MSVSVTYVLECDSGMNNGERLEVTITGDFSPWHFPLTGWKVAEEVKKEER